MRCPPEIAEILCEILKTGLLRIRALDDVARCKIEADHLHNLPGLLADYKPELLDYYWTVGRICYIEDSTPDEFLGFDSSWRLLAQRLPSAAKQAIAS